jgi:hypothetical protein
MVVSQYDTGPKNLLPKQYADQQKTPLTAAVRAEENSIDFDLVQVNRCLKWLKTGCYT